MLTGDDGSFVLFAPAPGRYRLAVRSDGYAVSELDVVVGDGADVVVSAELDPGPIQR